MWISSLVFLIFGTLSIRCISKGDIEDGVIFGAIALLCWLPPVFIWRKHVNENDKMKFIQSGSTFGKRWVARRRVSRAAIMFVLLSFAAVWIVVGFHGDVRRALRDNAVEEYERKLERQNIVMEEYQESLQQYYIEARLAMGLGEEGWLTADVTVSREAIERRGNIGGTLRFDCYVNDQSVRNGGQARVQVFADNKLESELTEIDPSENDVGVKTSTLYLGPQQLNSGITFNHIVTVSEGRGRYAGSYLSMLVTYTIRAITPLDLNALSNMEMPERPQMEILEKPELDDIPNDYIYTFSHNPFGQIALLALLVALCWYYRYAWGRDKVLLDEHIEKAKKEEKACAWKREQERQRLIKEKEEKARRQEEQKHLQMLREEEAQKDKEDAIADEALEYAIKKRETEDIEDAIAEAAYYYAINKERVRQQLQGKTVEEAAGVPRKVRFTEDLLPYDEGYPGKYGHYSVYMTPYASCYHAKRGCHGAQEEVHIFEALKKYKPPCLICARQYPYNIPQWYERYKILLKEKEYYNL